MPVLNLPRLLGPALLVVLLVGCIPDPAELEWEEEQPPLNCEEAFPITDDAFKVFQVTSGLNADEPFEVRLNHGFLAEVANVQIEIYNRQKGGECVYRTSASNYCNYDGARFSMCGLPAGSYCLVLTRDEDSVLDVQQLNVTDTPGARTCDDTVCKHCTCRADRCLTAPQ